MDSVNEYQRMAHTTAEYPDGKLGLLYVALGLTSEAGEVSGKIKKWVRGDGDLDKEGLAKEIGDCAWYLAELATLLDYPLGNILEANLAKLQDRKARGVIQGNGDDR